MNRQQVEIVAQLSSIAFLFTIVGIGFTSPYFSLFFYGLGKRADQESRAHSLAHALQG